MEDQKPTSFSFEIDKFTEKEGLIRSPKFFSGGCQWHLSVYPKGNCGLGYMNVFLCVANRESLRLGWKRIASYFFVLLNQSGKEIYRTSETLRQLFYDQYSSWGKIVTLRNFQEKGYLVNDKLIVKVEIRVHEAVDEAELTGKETIGIKGFQVLYSQVNQVNHIFLKHPDIALKFIPKSQSVKTSYMNLLLNLIEKLEKPSRSFTLDKLTDARSELIDLTEAGFKLDWLKKKLDEIFLEREKAITDGSRVEELEEHIENLKAELDKEKVKSVAKFLSLDQSVLNLRAELNNEKIKSATSAAKVLSLEQSVIKMNKKQKISPH